MWLVLLLVGLCSLLPSPLVLLLPVWSSVCVLFVLLLLVVVVLLFCGDVAALVAGVVVGVGVVGGLGCEVLVVGVVVDVVAHAAVFCLSLVFVSGVVAVFVFRRCFQCCGRCCCCWWFCWELLLQLV